MISIITITYNAERWLERTMRSVLAQTCTDYEYIIVDGGSKDGTVDIIRPGVQWTAELEIRTG